MIRLWGVLDPLKILLGSQIQDHCKLKHEASNDQTYLLLPWGSARLLASALNQGNDATVWALEPPLGQLLKHSLIAPWEVPIWINMVVHKTGEIEIVFKAFCKFIYQHLCGCFGKSYLLVVVHCIQLTYTWHKNDT